MTTAVNPNRHVALHSCGGYHDLRMACPMNLIAAVKIKHVKHKGVIVDRRITIILDCGCRRELSVPLTVPAPRPGEPARCWDQHTP